MGLCRSVDIVIAKCHLVLGARGLITAQVNALMALEL